MQVAALAAGALSASDLLTAVVATPSAMVATPPPATDGAASFADAAEPADAKIKQEQSGEGEGDQMENSDDESSEDKKASDKASDAAGRGGGGEDCPEEQHKEPMEVEDGGSEECNASNKGKRKAEVVFEPVGIPPQEAGGGKDPKEEKMEEEDEDEVEEEDEDEEKEEEEEEEDSEASSSDSDFSEPLETK